MQCSSDNHMELREALRDLCAQFKPEYHRAHDEAVSYTHLTLPTICSV